MQALDVAQSMDSISIKQPISLQEHAQTMHGIWSLPKWNFFGDIELQMHFDFLSQKRGYSFKELYAMFKRFCIQDDTPVGENLMLNAGINLMTNLLAGAGGTVFSNANGRIGVGDSSVAAAATQTGLQAATNKTFQAYDATYPTTGANQQFIARATFGGAAANYSWQEFTNDNGTTSLDRLVSNQGTKTSGQSWQPTITITFS